MTEIRRIPSLEIFAAPNAQGLMNEYASECSIPEIGKINPQADMYAAMEKAGLLHIFGVFREGELIGFAALLIYVLPHYGCKIATAESIFVKKQYRSGVGAELMETIERYAREQGCVSILYSAPIGSRFETLLSLKDHYRRTSSVFCRILR